MCEYSGKLIAWLDHELPDQEATNVEWHVGQCAECRAAVAAYREVSDAFLVCCQSALAAPPRRNRRKWAWSGVAATAAAAILTAILLVQPRAEKLSVHAPPLPHAPAIAFERPAFERPVRPIVRARSLPSPAQIPVRSQWIAVEPTVEVTLPADALFPPGAVPEGFSFIADVRP